MRLTVEHIQAFNRCACELTGTAMLVGLSCMGISSNRTNDRDLWERSFCYGLTVTVCVQCFGHISGAHVNPNVTIASYLEGLTSLYEGLIYIGLQLIGGFAGFFWVLLCISSATDFSENSKVCMQQVEFIPSYKALLLEFICTSILIIFCCAIWDERNDPHGTDSVPVRFGFLFMTLVLSSGAYTGASMNFARTLPPAMWNLDFSSIWVYFVGQLVAAILMPLLWNVAFAGQLMSDRVSRVSERSEY